MALAEAEVLVVHRLAQSSASAVLAEAGVLALNQSFLHLLWRQLWPSVSVQAGSLGLPVLRLLRVATVESAGIRHSQPHPTF